MPVEVALVFDKEGKTIAFHEPAGRGPENIPDTRSHWEVLEENWDRLGGVAHVHPWSGNAIPSPTDVTTFRAIEKGLGKILLWVVVTFDQVTYWRWSGKKATSPDGDYVLVHAEPSAPGVEIEPEIQGIEKLRELSRGEE